MSTWRLGNALNDQVPNPFFGVISAGALSGRTISRRQSLLPYPQYAGDTGVQRVFAPFGNSSYNGATFQAERRLAQSLTFLLGYTWSKAIDDLNTPIDVYNRRAQPRAVGIRYAASIYRKLGLPVAGRQGPVRGSGRGRRMRSSAAGT